MITTLRIFVVWIFSLGAMVWHMGGRGSDFLGWFLISALFWGLPLVLCLMLARALEETVTGALSGLFVAAAACGAMALMRFDERLLYEFAIATGAFWSLTYGFRPLARYWKNV